MMGTIITLLYSSVGSRLGKIDPLFVSSCSAFIPDIRILRKLPSMCVVVLLAKATIDYYINKVVLNPGTLEFFARKTGVYASPLECMTFSRSVFRMQNGYLIAVKTQIQLINSSYAAAHEYVLLSRQCLFARTS